MKRLLLLIPVLVLAAGCGTGKDATHNGRSILAHTAQIDAVPLQLEIAGLHRVGQVAALDLRLANRAPSGSDAFYVNDTFSSEGDYDVGGVLMLDPATGRQTTALAPDHVNLGMIEVGPGGTQLIRAVFPAP